MLIKFHPRRATIAAAALVLLSLLWACGTVRPDLLPNLLPIALPPFERQAVPFALLALVSTGMALARGIAWPRGRQFWRSQEIALSLIVAPALLMHLSLGWISGLTRAALFAVVPVFTVVIEPYSADDSEPKFRQPRYALPAALAALVGALFVFPVQIPTSVQSAAGWIAMILAAASLAWANCRAVQGMIDERPKSTDSTIALVAISGAAALFLASALFERPVWRWPGLVPGLVWSAVLELPALMLLFWLMQRISATRLTTRYVFAPLLAVLIGTVLLQSIAEVRPRTWLGLALMAAAATWLLIAPEQQVASDDHPIGLIPK